MFDVGCWKFPAFLPFMPVAAFPCPVEELAAWRDAYRAEMNCQVIHDSIHRRPGWTHSYRLEIDGNAAGFATLALAGPWKNRPTVLEFYVAPERRSRAFALFEAVLAASDATHIETQTNGTLLAVMLHAWSRDATSEKIVFRDAFTTALPSLGAVLRRVTSETEDRARFAQRDGSSEWTLELAGTIVGKGGIAFHYNPPYGDLYMEIAEPHRRHGLGAFLVQELKRICRDLGGIPAARCSPGNIASRQTCQKAGFVPCGHVLVGRVAAPTEGKTKLEV